MSALPPFRCPRYLRNGGERKTDLAPESLVDEVRDLRLFHLAGMAGGNFAVFVEDHHERIAVHAIADASVIGFCVGHYFEWPLKRLHPL